MEGHFCFKKRIVLLAARKPTSEYLIETRQNEKVTFIGYH